MSAYAGVLVELHSFLNSALDGGGQPYSDKQCYQLFFLTLLLTQSSVPNASKKLAAMLGNNRLPSISVMEDFGE
jgi:hypothetical protein